MDDLNSTIFDLNNSNIEIIPKEIKYLTILQELNNKRVKDIVESSYPEGSDFNKFSNYSNNNYYK